MKNLKKLSRENLKTINGGAPSAPLCQLGRGTPVYCFDPYSGISGWQCIVGGRAELCERMFPI